MGAWIASSADANYLTADARTSTAEVKFTAVVASADLAENKDEQDRDSPPAAAPAAPREHTMDVDTVAKLQPSALAVPCITTSPRVSGDRPAPPGRPSPQPPADDPPRMPFPRFDVDGAAAAEGEEEWEYDPEYAAQLPRQLPLGRDVFDPDLPTPEQHRRELDQPTASTGVRVTVRASASLSRSLRTPVVGFGHV